MTLGPCDACGSPGAAFRCDALLWPLDVHGSSYCDKCCSDSLARITANIRARRIVGAAVIPAREWTPPNPPDVTHTAKCSWCGEGCGDCSVHEGTVHAWHFNCMPYGVALLQRLSSGANDCPEERDAVKRWVDGQQASVDPLTHTDRFDGRVLRGGAAGLDERIAEVAASQPVEPDVDEWHAWQTPGAES